MTDTDVQFGISLPNRAVLFGVDPELLLTTAERAEASGGFDSVWVGDNFLSKPRLEAIVTLSALAARTRRLKLGTVCMASFPMRHPLLLALQWASLDRLSAGRTILAVCSGGSAKAGPLYAQELTTSGIQSADRVPRLEEGIEVLRLLWSERSASYRGRFHALDSVDLEPKPVQEHVPILLAANPKVGADPAIEERVLRRIARLADGWQTDGTPVDLFRERWQRIREYADEYGRAHEVTSTSLHIMVNINDDPRRARQEAVEFLDKYYGVGAISDEFLQTWLAHGSPEAVAEWIASYLEAGLTTPILRFASPDQFGQLERCVDEVLPRLGRRAVARVSS